MRRTFIVLAATAMAVALAAGTAFAARIVKVGQRANGTTVLLRTDDTLVVSLAGNATTGYSWKIRQLNRTIVKPLGTKYVPRKPIRPGSGGTYVLRFRAVAEGTTRLKLGYVQAGNTTARPAKTFVLTVAVRLPPKE